MPLPASQAHLPIVYSMHLGTATQLLLEVMLRAAACTWAALVHCTHKGGWGERGCLLLPGSVQEDPESGCAAAWRLAVCTGMPGRRRRE